MVNNVFEIQFENSLKITKFFLLLAGVKIPDNTFNKSVEYFLRYHLFYINTFILHSVIVGEIHYVVECFQTVKPIAELAFNIPCITVSMLATSKAIFLFLNKEFYYELHSKLKEIHSEYDKEEVNAVENELHVIFEAVKVLRSYVILMCVIIAIVISMFCFVPGLLMGYDYIKTGELTIIYPYMIKYNFFEAYKTSWWPLIYLHHVIATLVSCTSIFGCETFLFATCSYIVMHFRLLCLRFENIVAHSKEETKKNLTEAVRRHQDLINLVHLTEICYSKSSLFHIVTSSFLICLSAFIITITNEMNVKASFITFLVMSLSQISLVCYFGDMVMRSSTEISESVYKSAWYDADADAKKIMFLVIIRAQSECKLTASRFVDLNLRAFTRILSSSWSYFALLKTMYK